MTHRIRCIDSHTGGEPTRVVIDGGPPLGNGSLSERRQLFEREFDHYRSAIVNEPRGSDVLVGALVTEPVSSECSAGVIFFNNVGYLGMCGHGTIGLAVTLYHTGKIDLGLNYFDTPVGPIKVNLITPNKVEIENVPSYRLLHNIEIDVPRIGVVKGDVAWGGNWFFISKCDSIPLNLVHVNDLIEHASNIKHTLANKKMTGEDGMEIDHIELYSEGSDGAVTNFVLCPGLAYDRSPCGTGTSAKIACLAEDKLLEPEQWWSQRSICGSKFDAKYRQCSNKIIPTVSGSAYITGENILLLDSSDPFVYGLK